jgi:hypothetical protein
MEIITEVSLNNKKSFGLNKVRIVKLSSTDLEEFYSVELLYNFSYIVEYVQPTWKTDSFHTFQFQASSRAAIVIASHTTCRSKVISDNTLALHKYEDEDIETLRSKSL